MHILLVDDDERFTTATCEIIRHLGHEAQVEDSVEGALSCLEKSAEAGRTVDVLLLDVMLPDGNGFEILQRLPQSLTPKKIAFITGHESIISLVRKVAGPDAQYLIKPIGLEDLKSVLTHRKQDKQHSGLPGLERHFGVLIGEDPQMQAIYDQIEKVARTGANVLIQGESGTGKELVAQAIHNASTYEGPFVAANCGAISPELLGSELFGHEKGAFTGAVSRKEGYFEQADNGTLFLDEITEMPIDMQPSLLRVLETSQVTRLGSTQAQQVSCRVVSATNRTQQQLMEENCLREDIYFRLAIFPIQLPPLRERPSDIPLLARYFIHQFNDEHDTQFQLTDSQLQRLKDYSWPGNVREMRHLLYRAFIMSDRSTTDITLPETLESPFAKESANKSSLEAGVTIQEVERELISVTLKKVEGDKRRAADMLGISLKTLYNRLNEYQKEQLA